MPDEIKTERGFISIDANYQTSAPGVYAVGDAARLGLLTDAIGSGRKAAVAIDDMLRGREERHTIRFRRSRLNG
ncbi:MAG: FAD-dependent oxidoreductase [Syntrophobacterales bacterium]|nr:FAD-dependent oxidoreductase [Syntrophobacterales bacterium]